MDLQRKLAAYIAAKQSRDGSFSSLRRRISPAKGQPVAQTSVFVTALVLRLLSQVDLPELEPVKSAGVRYLLSQRSESWTFNYWPRGSREERIHPYPDDWDDTSLAILAIQDIAPTAVDGTAWARITQLLAACEANVGGPYRTWLDGRDEWGDVDVFVNAQIGAMLASQDVNLVALEQMVTGALETNTFTSMYYASNILGLWYASQWYTGTAREQLYVLAMMGAESAWHVSLARIIAAQTGVPQDEVTQLEMRLNRLTYADIIRPVAVCYDPDDAGMRTENVSDVVGAAAVLAAHSTGQRPHETVRGGEWEHTHSRIRTAIDSVIERWPPVVAGIGADYMERLLESAEGRLITLTPYYARAAIASDANETWCDELSLVSAFGWMSYSIYDDFMDGEGRVEYMPVANLAHIEMTARLRTLGYWSYSQRVLATMTEAQSIELITSRFKFPDELATAKIPDYGNYSLLYDRAAGHGLGWAHLFMRAGHGPSSFAFHQMMAFFRHYIIARQLNDEAHDWEEDLRRGAINAVAARLLEQGPPDKHVEAAIRTMRLRFWQEELPRVCDDIERELSMATQAIGRCRAIGRPEYLLDLLDPLHQSVVRARTEQRLTRDFLASYGENERNARKLR